MKKPWTILATMLFAVSVAVAGDARGSDCCVSLSEVAAPPPSAGVDQATFRASAEGELRGIDASHVKKRQNQKVLVSVAVTNASDAPASCTVSAMLRDAKSGTMIAIIEGRAHGEGSATPDLKKSVLRAAVRSAVRQIPDTLAAN